MIAVALTGRGCAGPWGVTPVPPRGATGASGTRRVASELFRFAPFEVVPAHPGAVDGEPDGLPRRQLRYLARNSRLAIAACRAALGEARFPADPGALEPLACLVAGTRGPTDPKTTLEMIRAARLAEPGGCGRLVARAAHETYMRHRPQVQYLMSMETAVVGHVTAALGARGPAHAVTTPGLAGGAQAIVRAALAVARGEAPAALACGVFTAEDEAGAAELLDLACGGERRVAVEGSGAVLLEDAATAERAGRRAWCRVEVAEESFGSLGGPEAGSRETAPENATVVDERRAVPFAGAARALWALCAAGRPRRRADVRLRGCLGHAFRFDLEPLPATPTRTSVRGSR